MSTFHDLRDRVEFPDKLTRLNSTEIDALQSAYPEIPRDYLNFLSHVGFGNLGEFQLYGGPTEIVEYFSPVPEPLEGILVFGDDMQGYLFGFSPRDGFRVVEVGPHGELATDVEPDFLSLLASYLGRRNE